MNSIERIINARLTFVADDYIDFLAKHPGFQNPSSRFAKIDKKDFPEFEEKGQKYDAYFLLMDSLKEAIRKDYKLNLVIEKREIEMEHANSEDISPKKRQMMDFLIKVEYTENGQGE